MSAGRRRELNPSLPIKIMNELTAQTRGTVKV
jgi:hypothetical protein